MRAQIRLLLLLLFACLTQGDETPVTYFYNVSHEHDVVPLNSPLADPAGMWSMKAVITERQLTENDMPELHYFLIVTRARNNAGTFEELPDNMMLQTYIQLKDPFKSDEYGKAYYENYVSSIKYVAAELGKVRSLRYYSSASCGTTVLGTLDGMTYSGVKGEKDECGFYLKSLEEMGI